MKLHFNLLSLNTHRTLGRSADPSVKKQLLISSVSIISRIVSIANLLDMLCSLYQLVFPSSHPSEYWPGSMMLNFSDKPRTSVSV